jgi:hypothetical protein
MAMQKTDKPKRYLMRHDETTHDLVPKLQAKLSLTAVGVIRLAIRRLAEAEGVK